MAGPGSSSPRFTYFCCGLFTLAWIIFLSNTNQGMYGILFRLGMPDEVANRYEWLFSIFPPILANLSIVFIAQHRLSFSAKLKTWFWSVLISIAVAVISILLFLLWYFLNWKKPGG